MNSDNSGAGGNAGFTWTAAAVFIAKLAIAAAAVAWLHWHGLLNFAVLMDVSHSPRTVLLLVGGCVSMFAAVLLLALRLQLMLVFERFEVGAGPATLITFVGLFFGTVLPGSVGADAVRITYFSSRVQERRMDAVTAILFDRVVGLYSLLLLGSLALAAAWLAGMWRDGFEVLIVAPVLLALTTVGALLYAYLGHDFLPAVLIKRMPWRLSTLLAGTRRLLRSFPLLGTTVGISLLSHGFMVFSFVSVALVIADPLPLFLHFVISPLAVTLNAVPISPGGLGITEGAFAYLFHAAGSGNGALIGLLGRLLQYCVYAIGGSISLLFLRWRGERYASIAQDRPGWRG